jgi:uncharacterized protein YycO
MPDAAFTPQVLLFRGSGVVDFLIKKQTGGIYSHAALRIGPNTVIESYPGTGVRERTLSPEDWKTIDAFSVPMMPEGGWDKAIAFGRKQIGCGYDWGSVFAFVTRGRGGKEGVWFCSELVVAMISEGGVELFRRDDPGGIVFAKVHPSLIAGSWGVKYVIPAMASPRPVSLMAAAPPPRTKQ